MTKHTPGPWKVSRADRDGAEVRAIASVAWCGAAASFGLTETQTIDGDEAYANACLVAAAPDLLAALRLLVIACTEDVAPDGYTTLGAPDRASMRNAHTAIDKATRGLYDNWSVEEEQLQERRAHACDR